MPWKSGSGITLTHLAGLVSPIRTRSLAKVTPMQHDLSAPKNRILLHYRDVLLQLTPVSLPLPCWFLLLRAPMKSFAFVVVRREGVTEGRYRQTRRLADRSGWRDRPTVASTLYLRWAWFERPSSHHDRHGHTCSSMHVICTCSCFAY